MANAKTKKLKTVGKKLYNRYPAGSPGGIGGQFASKDGVKQLQKMAAGGGIPALKKPPALPDPNKTFCIAVVTPLSPLGTAPPGVVGVPSDQPATGPGLVREHSQFQFPFQPLAIFLRNCFGQQGCRPFNFGIF